MPQWVGVWTLRLPCLIILVLQIAVSYSTGFKRIFIYYYIIFIYIFDLVDMTGGLDGTLVVKTSRDVKEGEELCVSYCFYICLNNFYGIVDILCRFALSRFQRYSNPT